MEIEIKVLEEQVNLDRRQLDRLRRTINVMCDDGFSVNLSFKNGENHDNKDENDSPYMGGRYEHMGYYVRLRKNDMFPK